MESQRYAKSSLNGSNLIVCGRGKSFDLLPGNLTFRQVISGYANQYSSFQKSRTKKSILIRWIASYLKESGMIFVKRTRNGETKLDSSEILTKIGHALRDVPKLLQKSISSCEIGRSFDFNHSKRKVVKTDKVTSYYTNSRDDMMQKSKPSCISTSCNSDCGFHHEKLYLINKGSKLNDISQNDFHCTFDAMNEITEIIFDDDMDTWSIHEDSDKHVSVMEKEILRDSDERLCGPEYPIELLFDNHNIAFCHLCQAKEEEVGIKHDKATLSII